MSDDGDRAPGPSRSLPGRWLGRLRDRLAADDDPRSQRLAARADRIFDQLDAAAGTLRRVAEVELRLVEKLVPIVENLGELVRLNLEEARERRGGPGPAKSNVIEGELDD